MRSGFENKAAQIAIVEHEEVCIGLHTDIVGETLPDNALPGWPKFLIQGLLDGLGGQFGHVGHCGVALDTRLNCVHELSQHFRVQVMALGNWLPRHLLLYFRHCPHPVQYFLLCHPYSKMKLYFYTLTYLINQFKYPHI